MNRIVYFFFLFAIFKTTYGQKVQKDTLFFNLDKNYFIQYAVTPDRYYLKDRNSDGIFYLESTQEFKNLKPKKILCLKKYVRRSQYYNKKKIRKVNQYQLFLHLNEYVIFLVHKNKYSTKYIKVLPIYSET